MLNRLQCSVKVTFAWTGEPGALCVSLHCKTCFVVVVWSRSCYTSELRLYSREDCPHRSLNIATCLLPPYCLTLLCFFPQSHLIILLDLLAYGFSSLSASLRVCVCVKSLQSCPTRCNPMDCSLLGSSVCGILQSRILEWVAMLFSWGSSRPRGPTWVFCTAGRLFTLCFHLLDYNFQ